MKNNCKIYEFEQFNKPYKIIAFDWDGTAVENRKVDASVITAKLEELMKLGVIIYVVTGTNINNIDRQFISLINKIGTECHDPQFKEMMNTNQYMQNLYIATNRGSEVFGFKDNQESCLLYRREATEEENSMLDKIAERTKKEIEGTSNAKVEIVYNRLNRRKLDLIPEWPDPQKAEIDKLLAETQKKLNDSGFSGGIEKAFKLMQNLAQTSGFTKAKITSDVKHIEIGLTDKSDSISWMLDNIARKNQIEDKDILIGGDEFGSIASFQGSDYKMVLPEHPDITYFSVGIEPDGVPNPVLYLGGGPECFLKVIELQIEIHEN